MCVCVCVLEIDEENPCAALRCLFLRGESPLHQRWGRFSNIKHHFQWRIIETAPVRYAARLAVILFGHRAAPKDVLKCSKNGPYIEKKTNKQTKIIWCTDFLFLLLIKNLIFFSFVQNKQIKEWKNLVTFLFSSPASLKLLPIMSFETKWKQKKNSFCWEQTGPVDPLLMISLLQVLILSTSNKPSCV